MLADLQHSDITDVIIGAAIEVHRTLGPGLLESAYEMALCRELDLQAVEFVRQVRLPMEYKGVKLDCGYRVDMIVDNVVVVEIKAIERTLPVHEAQLLTYMRLLQIPVGLLMNFHVEKLRNGLVRRVL